MIIENTPYTPESVGYDSEQLTVLHQFFQEQMDKGILRAANYALARDGKLFAAASLGKQSYNESDERPMNIEVIYPICSITKLFTAVAIFKLVEMGKVRMSQPVSEWISEFAKPPFSGINIAHLLSHTSGFAVDPHAYTYEGDNHYDLIEKAFESGDINWIRVALGVDLCFETGKEWGYSTFGYSILAEIIRRASGMTEKEFMTKYFFEPCQMTDTSYEVNPEKLDRMIVNHKRMEQHIEDMKNKKEPDSMEQLWQSIPYGGSGIFSTTYDLLKFGNMLMNYGTYQGKRVLGRKTVEKLASVYTTEEVLDKCWGNPIGYYRRYGLGPDKRCNEDCLYSPETYFHEGAGRCALIIDPTEKMVAVYLIPYIDGDLWDPIPIWNAHSVIWAGLF